LSSTCSPAGWSAGRSTPRRRPPWSRTRSAWRSRDAGQTTP
jgi:hypothetical protein